MKQNQHGFTLIEIMVVIAIIGILGMLVAPSVIDNVKKARMTTAKAQMQNFEQALQFYQLDYGKYPTTSQGLKELLKPGKSYPNGYIQDIPPDPWDNEYKYRCVGGKYEIVCLGADGEEGGTEDAADIKVPEKRKP